MDAETAEALDRLSESVTELRGDGVAVRSDLQTGLAAVRSDMQAGFAEVRSEIRGLRSEMHAGLADVKSHSLMLHESLRDDIRILAEAVASIGTGRGGSV